MTANKAGGLKSARILLSRDPDHYKKIGAKGGAVKTSKPKGFAAMSLEARMAAGAKGGHRSKRGPSKKSWQQRYQERVKAYASKVTQENA